MTDTVLGRTMRMAAPGLSLLLACCLSGCLGGVEPPKTPRVDASGKVDFDGQPLPAGTVTFLHHDTGHMAICMIKDGYYESESGEGPNPGTNTVTIMGKETADGYPMWQRPWTKDVQVGEEDFAEDFSIKSSEVKALDPSTIQVDE